MPAPSRTGGLFLWVPHVLVAVPFFLAGAAYALWVPAVAAVTFLIGHQGRRLTRCDDRGGIRGPVLAVLVAGTLLLELGLLLAVRLVVVPKPQVSFAKSLTAESLGAAWSVLLQPLLGLLAVIVLLRWAPRWVPPRQRPDRATHALRPPMSRGPKTASEAWSFSGLSTSAAKGAMPASRRQRRLAQHPALIMAVVAVPFLLPLLAGGGAALKFGPVATPEYGKVLLCGALAVLVARDSYRFRDVHLLRALRQIRQTSGGMLRRPALVASYRTSRFLLLPVALFGLVAIASGLRHDFGTIVPAALVTMGVTWCATRHNLDSDRIGDEPAAPGVRLVVAYRLFIGVAVLLIGGAVTLFATDYVGERGRVWSDPWRFRWSSACAVVPATPELRAAVPANRVPCLRSLAADAESEESQVAQAISATADGGLWGRGLRDRVSGAVAAGPTDFVLAVVWNKLGGFVVIGVGLLVMVLAAGLVRAAEHSERLRLFAAGLGAMIVGQYLFVLATTANAIPHTGIPAPLLSRGGQSTLALLIGIAVVLAGARRSAPAIPAPRRVVSTTMLVGSLAGIVTVLTLVPYAAPGLGGFTGPRIYRQDRPLCPPRPAERSAMVTQPPDPKVCSTDLIALARTRIAVTFPGGGRLALDRTTGEWEPEHPEALSGLAGADLAGLTNVPGGPTGLIERTYPDLIGYSAGARLSRRLLPPERDRVDGGLALTLDPGLQHVLAGTVSGPEPAAVVVLDRADGRVLASAGGPGSGKPPKVNRRQAERFGREHRHYVRPEPDGRVDDSAADPACVRRSRDGAGQRECWRWSYTVPEPAGSDRALGQAYPFDGAADLVLRAAEAEGRDPGEQAELLGLGVGDCGGPDRWTVPRLAGSVASCLPDPPGRDGSRGTPLAFAVIAGAVAADGRAVHPGLVDGVTHPATGGTEAVPDRPAVTAFSPGTAERLRASFQPGDGLRRYTTEAGNCHWTAGYAESGTVAFAVVVETPDRAAADARTRRTLAALSTWIGGR
ncbi:hypothetical protein Areg01_60840 [Actinoplanes regularis]|nr:hypothetical protein Areg01_60840 [Actinoplanes regularis]